MSEEEHIYKIRYKIEKGNFKKEELEELEWGGTDNLLLCSIIKDKDELNSAIWIGIDEELNDLNSVEMFKYWFMLTGKISESKDVLDWQKKIVDEVLRVVRETVKKMKETK